MPILMREWTEVDPDSAMAHAYGKRSDPYLMLEYFVMFPEPVGDGAPIVVFPGQTKAEHEERICPNCWIRRHYGQPSDWPGGSKELQTVTQEDADLMAQLFHFQARDA